MKNFLLAKSNPAISVIVPVYNAEGTLQRCVDSILEQTFVDFELVLIDDGSPDNCKSICADYAAKDTRIKVIHQSNGGVSSARQTGIASAIGKYSIHVDADDWVEPAMLEELYELADKTNSDMVVCDYILELPHKTKYMQQEPQTLTADMLLRLYLSGKFHAALWNKLIKTECYANVYFPKGINFGEDLYVIGNMLAYGNIQNIAYLEKAFYHYDNTKSNNITNHVTKKIFDAQIFLTDYFMQILDNDKYDHELTSLCITAKRMALELGTFNQKQFIELYKQINQQIKLECGIMRFFPSACLYIAVRGMYKTGFFLNKVWNRFIHLMAQLHKK